MRHILLSLIVLAAFLSSCEDMYTNQKKFEGEIVYPARFDTIIGHIGFERVEIDLMKAGRIPSSKIKLGKAKKTVIEYENEVITIDSLASWVNITDLTATKLYRFKVYTIDEYDNKSVPQEIALIPYTSSDLEALQVAAPRVMKSPSAAVVDWPRGISSVLMNYISLTYEYTDKNGAVRSGARDADSRFFIGNLDAGQTVAIKMNYRIVPKINNQTILDTITLNRDLNISMPTSSSEFAATERNILAANGVTVYTADGVSSIEKLVYPVHANSLQDIFYFPNLKILDLTGGDLFTLPELTYDRNGVTDIVGGGEFVPFLRKAGDIASGNTQALKDLLESGILQKVYYRPNSMGLDELLSPYVASGVVELVGGPASVLIPDKFQLDGVVQDGNWRCDITYPATDAPAGEGLENVYKTVLKAKNATFVFALPKEYEFNINEYKYLKFKVYAPAKSFLSGTYDPYQRIWFRFMNSMWSFGGNSSFGQQYWEYSRDDFRIADNDLQKWTDVTVDLSSALGKHNRVILFNIGGEPSLDWPPPADIVYYFANIRLTKE
ncbi:MAG: DUF4998 domain-containing protein [Prolixibacteraceae bacterium]|jgi:hypothetical protein